MVAVLHSIDFSYTGTTLVDELVYVGVGNAWWPGGGDPNPGNPVGGTQAAMDDFYAWVMTYGPVTVTCTYEMEDFSGRAAVDVVAVPAPNALLLGSLGLGLIGWLRSRRIV